MKKIFIDAGHNHSGFNTGAVGNGMREQDITFEVARDLGEFLANGGFDVQLSRPTLQTNLGHDNNSAINARWQMANAWGADYFISIHANAGGGTGAETFIAATKPDDRPFAVAVNDFYAAEMGLRNRGVKPDTQAAVGSIGVLRHTNMPAILVELAFIDSPLSNPDVEILRNRRREMAQALATGIFKYFGVNAPVSSQAPVVANRFGSVDEMPDWARPTIQKMIRKGLLQGNRGGGIDLDLSLDMIRIFVIHDRAGIYD